MKTDIYLFRGILCWINAVERYTLGIFRLLLVSRSLSWDCEEIPLRYFQVRSVQLIKTKESVLAAQRPQHGEKLLMRGRGYVAMTTVVLWKADWSEHISKQAAETAFYLATGHQNYVGAPANIWSVFYGIKSLDDWMTVDLYVWLVAIRLCNLQCQPNLVLGCTTSLPHPRVNPKLIIKSGLACDVR